MARPALRRRSSARRAEGVCFSSEAYCFSSEAYSFSSEAYSFSSKAKTLVQGLTPASTMTFRYRTTLKNVVSDWKQTQGIVVR